MIQTASPAVSQSVFNRGSASSEGAPDEVLLAAIAAGDERSCLTFVRRYQSRLFGLALAIVGEPTAAEDVAQEAFVRIVRHAAIFDARRGSVATWVLTITRNLAIDSVRVRRGVPFDPHDSVFAELVGRDRSPEDSALLGDAVAQARAALADLPVEQRRAIVLASLYGRTAEEISKAESIPLGTAKSRIRLGLATLRSRMNVAESP